MYIKLIFPSLSFLISTRCTFFKCKFYIPSHNSSEHTERALRDSSGILFLFLSLSLYFLQLLKAYLLKTFSFIDLVCFIFIHVLGSKQFHAILLQNVCSEKDAHIHTHTCMHVYKCVCVYICMHAYKWPQRKSDMIVTGMVEKSFTMMF